MKYLVQNPLYRIYSSLNEREQILTICTLFSLGLQAFRIFYTGQLLFSFLVWNLFLAFIPYPISSRMETWVRENSKWKALLLQNLLIIVF